MNLLRNLISLSSNSASDSTIWFLGSILLVIRADVFDDIFTLNDLNFNGDYASLI